MNEKSQFDSKRIFNHGLNAMFLEDDDPQDIAVRVCDGVQDVLDQTKEKAKKANLRDTHDSFVLNRAGMFYVFQHRARVSEQVFLNVLVMTTTVLISCSLGVFDVSTYHGDRVDRVHDGEQQDVVLGKIPIVQNKLQLCDQVKYV